MGYYYFLSELVKRKKFIFFRRQADGEPLSRKRFLPVFPGVNANPRRMFKAMLFNCFAKTTFISRAAPPAPVALPPRGRKRRENGQNPGARSTNFH